MRFWWLRVSSGDPVRTPECCRQIATHPAAFSSRLVRLALAGTRQAERQCLNDQNSFRHEVFLRFASALPWCDATCFYPLFLPCSLFFIFMSSVDTLNLRYRTGLTYSLWSESLELYRHVIDGWKWSQTNSPKIRFETMIESKTTRTVFVTNWNDM